MTRDNSANPPTARESHAAPTRGVFVQLARAGLQLPARPHAAITHAGSLALFPHQQEAAHRLLPLLKQSGGALLADAVGLGKTFVALALLAEFDSADIIAPAGLVAMWHAALTRTAITPAPPVHSLHRYSQPLAVTAGRQTASRTARHLIVIDEAHHLRNPNTQRYRQVADWCRNASVLLLTATPVHNSARDLEQLLALFLGSRAFQLSPVAAAAFVVRRAESGGGAVEGGASSASPHDQRPRTIAHSAVPVSDSVSVTRALAALPPPLPTRTGRAAGALVTLGLVRAWCSSGAACLVGVRRRRARASVLADALAMGRWPSAEELRSWTVSDDTVQLGFTALLTAPLNESAASEAIAQARAQLVQHQAGLSELESAVRDAGLRADRERVALLRRVCTEHRGVPVVAFTQFAETLHALGRTMRWDAGVATLTAQRGRVAGGPLTRDEILRRFAPQAHGVAPPAPHERILLLITTDLLAEGVNLQDAGVIVHIDLPWTAAAIAQREGRLTRIGSPHTVVHVYAFTPPGGGDALLHLAARLRRKARAAAMSLAIDAAPAPVPRLVAIPTAHSPLQQLLRAWLAEERLLNEHVAHQGDWIRPSVLAHARAGWLAAVHTSESSTVLVGGWFTHQDTRTRATSEPRTLLQLVRAAEAGRSMATPPSTPDHVTRLGDIARRACARLAREQLTTQLANPVQSVQQRALRQLRQRVHAASLRERYQLAPLATQLAERLRAMRGIGTETRLTARLAEVETLAIAQWIRELLQVLAPSAMGTGTPDHTLSTATVAPPVETRHVSALVLLIRR